MSGKAGPSLLLQLGTAWAFPSSIDVRRFKEFGVPACVNQSHRSLPIIQVVITVLVTVWADRSSWLLLGDSARVPGPYVHVDLFVLFFRVIWRGV